MSKLDLPLYTLEAPYQPTFLGLRTASLKTGSAGKLCRKKTSREAIEPGSHNVFIFLVLTKL